VQQVSTVEPVVARGSHVRRRFGQVLALSDVSFELTKGVTGLLGANGAGKTTLIKLLLGVLKPNGGSLEVLGLDPLSAGYRLRQRVGYASEDDRFPPDVKANELVRHFAEMRGIPHRAAVVRASDVLFEVGLGEERFRPLGTMSTGQRQRVKLAQALVHDPELVLLDEPTNGLDPIQRDEMLALVRRVGTDLGFTVLVSSHLLGEIQQVSDRIVMLEGGRVTRSGTVADLLGTEAPLAVEVVSGAARLAECLRSKGFQAVAKDDLRLTIDRPDGSAHAAVLEAVVTLDLELRRMESVAIGLGDLFEAGEAQPA
jgi:ABC-2 type transport system ATP-binding protein